LDSHNTRTSFRGALQFDRGGEVDSPTVRRAIRHADLLRDDLPEFGQVVLLDDALFDRQAPHYSPGVYSL